MIQDNILALCHLLGKLSKSLWGQAILDERFSVIPHTNDVLATKANCSNVAEAKSTPLELETSK